MGLIVPQLHNGPDHPLGLAVCTGRANPGESGLRNPNLGFHHHKAVESIPPEKQKEILQQASENKWTVRETREAVKAI